MITYVLKVWVFIQHSVVGIQEKLQGVLVQEMHLEQDRKKDLFSWQKKFIDYLNSDFFV